MVFLPLTEYGKTQKSIAVNKVLAILDQPLLNTYTTNMVIAVSFGICLVDLVEGFWVFFPVIAKNI